VSVQNNSAAIYVCLASYTASYARGPELCVRFVCTKNFKEDGIQKLLADIRVGIFFLPPSYPKNVKLKMYHFYSTFTFTLREEHTEGIRREGAVDVIGT
jgi:hypothetical protein